MPIILDTVDLIEAAQDVLPPQIRNDLIKNLVDAQDELADAIADAEGISFLETDPESMLTKFSSGNDGTISRVLGRMDPEGSWP
jgi:hypothetical protein